MYGQHERTLILVYIVGATSIKYKIITAEKNNTIRGTKSLVTTM